jgi:hypothetical protein
MRGITIALALFLALAHTSGFAEQSDVLLSQNTESESLPNSIFPKPAMIMAIFSSYEADRQQMYRRMLKECMIDKKVSLRKLFRATPLPKIGTEDTVYFVRPSAEPFCLGFYGAHNFQFWLVTQSNKVLYSGGADNVTIFKTNHNEMYDIEIEHGGGWGVSRTQFEFDGGEYKPVRCDQISVDEHGLENSKTVQCQN